MKVLMFGDCSADRTFLQSDPDAPAEVEFTAAVVRALKCAYPDYTCIVFTGSFEHNDQVFRPDLALVAKDFSHWFVIEVELLSHSLNGHVLPQVRAFKHGQPQPDCLTILARELSIDRQQAATLLTQVPRSVVVIANRRDETWQISLAAIPVQFAAVSVFRTTTGTEALEFDGSLDVLEESLGFGTYSAPERSLVFPASVRLKEGEVQINDPISGVSIWLVGRNERSAWITKAKGSPSIPNGAHVQLIRTVKGTISMRMPGVV